jgi:hypothetical protein
MNAELLNAVPGDPELLDWFGYAPRLHDSEVLSVAFDREGPTCILRVHGFEMTPEVDARGYFVLTKHLVITFRLGELTGMQLDDFGFQNALMGLSISRGPDQRFRIELDPANGLGGFIEGLTLSITIEPGIPAGSMYAR